MKKITSITEIKIPFYDLDPMNVVWHGNYIKYIEKARCDLLKKLGYDYTDMYKDGIMYPIAKLDLKFINSATFNQEIFIKCELEEYEPAIIIKYEIVDKKTNTKILSAKTMQIQVDTKSKTTLYKAPEKLVEKIEGYK